MLIFECFGKNIFIILKYCNLFSFFKKKMIFFLILNFLKINFQFLFLFFIFLKIIFLNITHMSVLKKIKIKIITQWRATSASGWG